jgi:hypothetical protein
MLERAAGFEPSASLGRFKIHTRYKRRAWIVVVEPDDRFNLLMVVTAYEVY